MRKLTLAIILLTASNLYAQNPVTIANPNGSIVTLAQDTICTSSKIYDTNTSGNTQLVAISGTTHIYICGYEMLAAGTVTLQLVAGTGSACASAVSGTPNTGNGGANAALTPAWSFTAQTGKISAWPTHGYLIDAGSGNAVCLKTNGAVAAQVQIFYFQQ